MRKFVALIVTITLLCSYLVAIAEDYQHTLEQAFNYLNQGDYDNVEGYEDTFMILDKLYAEFGLYLEMRIRFLNQFLHFL